MINISKVLTDIKFRLIHFNYLLQDNLNYKHLVRAMFSAIWHLKMYFPLLWFFRMKTLICFLLIMAVTAMAMAYPFPDGYPDPIAAGFAGYGREWGDEVPGYEDTFNIF